VKTLAEYVALSYTVVLRKDEEGDFVARIEELPGCVAHAATATEALEILGDVQREWISDAIERGDPIPLPATEEGLPSGKWLQRVPRTLHAKLVRRARNEGVSLNLLVSTILAEAVGGNAQSRRAGGEKVREGGRVFFTMARRYFAPSEAPLVLSSSATESQSSDPVEVN
jgi:predicted RNase H-like HicB family nuclease